MRAVVFKGLNDLSIQNVPDPKIEEPTDVVVKVSLTSVCGTDLHFLHGKFPDFEAGTIPGHECVGKVVETGRKVSYLKEGDRVVVPSTIACGYCEYCRQDEYSQCDNANPNGSEAGTAFFGGPKSSGAFAGMQAEYVRVPYADVGPVKLPDEINDEQALCLSDIFPTAYFGCDEAGVLPGDTVAVFGAGPVGLFAVRSAYLMGAERVVSIDTVEARLNKAEEAGAIAVDFRHKDPVEAIMEVTEGRGADVCIEAVGLEAACHHPGTPHGKECSWQTMDWAIEGVKKAGNVGAVGVFSQESVDNFAWGQAFNKNVTVTGGNCPHRRYIDLLLDYLESGIFDPTWIITHRLPFDDALRAYKLFDEKEEGCVKVALKAA